MSTIKAIIAEYGTAEIPLERICERYLGIGTKVAKERAAAATLPLPAYKTARNAPAKGTLRQYKMAGERLKEVFAEFAPDEIKAVHVQE